MTMSCAYQYNLDIPYDAYMNMFSLDAFKFRMKYRIN